MLASFGLRWWQHMIVRGLDENSVAADVTGSRKTTLIRRIQVCPSDSTFNFKMRRRRYPARIAFGVAISKTQGQNLILYIAVYSPFFPLASSLWLFPYPLHLTMSPLCLLNLIDNIRKMIDREHQILQIENCFKI
jgi:hypothetical protein